MCNIIRFKDLSFLRKILTIGFLLFLPLAVVFMVLQSIFRDVHESLYLYHAIFLLLGSLFLLIEGTFKEIERARVKIKDRSNGDEELCKKKLKLKKLDIIIKSVGFYLMVIIYLIFYYRFIL